MKPFVGWMFIGKQTSIDALPIHIDYDKSKVWIHKGIMVNGKSQNTIPDEKWNDALTMHNLLAEHYEQRGYEVVRWS